MKITQHEIDKIGLTAELTQSHCDLNHGPETNPEDFPATDFLVLPLGTNESEVVSNIENYLYIAVCMDCWEALQPSNKEWTLCYCVNCNESQWIARKYSKLHYRHKVLWLNGCPECGSKFGGLYFCDDQFEFPNAPSEDM